MTKQHTSGPWAALMQNPPTVADRRGCRIATACQLPGDSMEEQQANARLIAAAPELLAALRGLLVHFEGPQCLASDYPGSFYMAELERARDAIKSATGGNDQ
jgi:hypothetical protein